MTVKDKVGTLARTGVDTAVSVVRHPIGSAFMAAGFAKGAAEASVHLVRSTITGRFPVEPAEGVEPDDAAVEDAIAPEPTVTEPTVQEPAAQEPAAQEPAVQEPAVQEPAVQELLMIR